MQSRLVLALLMFLPIWAQTKGTISGDVTDPSGSAVPGATVKIRAAAIGIDRETTTNETGSFVVPYLPGGDYSVTVEAAGFKGHLRSGVRLDTDQVVNLKVQLEVGQLSEKVTVEAAAPLVDSSTAEVSRLITESNLQNYALPGRNPYYMLGILPGVVSRYGNFTTDFRATSYSMGGLMVNGNRKDTNFVTLDGVNNTRTRDGVQVNNILGVDFIEEVNVYTSRYAAEFGRSTGGQISFITRRGKQDFHLSAYEFFMSDQFAATQAVTNSHPRLRYHNYGFTLSGPAYLPKKWNTEKNKLFYFFGLEGRWQAGFNQKLSIVPTPAVRSGNFAGTTVPRDPDTGAPFPNAVIPVSRISKLGQALQKIYPDPNYTGSGGNYFAVRAQPTDNQDWVFRTDYNIKQNWQLTLRGLHGDQNFTSPFDNTGNNIPLFEVYRHRRGNNFAAGLTTTISPTLINEFTLGESDYRENFILQGDGYKRETWGVTFPMIYSGGNNGNRIPAVSITGLTGITGSTQPSKAATPTYIVRDNLTKVWRTHNIKAGFYWEQMSMNELNQAADNGSFSFGLSASNPKNSGVAWANALLGNFDSYSEAGVQTQTVYKAYAREFYAQDSWRFRRNLTLEYGMRYSLISPWSAKWNNIVAFMPQFWDPAKAPQVAANGTIVNGTGDPYNGLVLPGSGFPDSANGRITAASDPALKALFRGVPEGFNPLRKTNFQPRLSVAWDVLGNAKMVVRSGFGIFQGVTGIAYSGWYLGARAPLVKSIAVSNGSADNPGSGIASTTLTPIGANSLPTEYKIPTMYQYSFGIQSQLPFRTLLDVAYVGNSGRHLSLSRPLNFLTPEEQAAHQGVDLRPFYPYRGLGGITLVEPSATSQFNSMQLLVKRRSRDLTYSFAYTLSKNVGYGIEGIAGGIQNPLNVRADRSELEESRRHNVVVTHTYETPWFREQKGWQGRILGGWSINGLWTWNDGRLYSPSVTSVARGVATRPNVVGEWRIPDSEKTMFRMFNTAAFARPADWTFGNAGKWVIRGPGSFDLSAFALKNVRVAERATLQLRLEAFNALNHPYFTDVATTLGQSNFGQASGVSTPRYLQLGAKFIY